MPKTPIDYSKAVIYKICCKDLKVTDVYVGSTTNLIERRRLHKSACHSENGKKYNYPVYRFIREHGDWDNWEVIKVQDVVCNCSDDLLKIERECLERLGATLNTQVPGNQIGKSKKEYDKVYRDANREKIIKQTKEYRDTNKIEIAQKRAVKVQCACGSEVSKKNISAHYRSKKHKAYLENSVNHKIEIEV